MRTHLLVQCKAVINGLLTEKARVVEAVSHCCVSPQ